MASVGGGSGNQISLNVMPMLDIFSILILFLLMTFSSDPINHDLNAGIELPDSNTLKSLDEIPAVTMSKTEILVNDKKIISLINGRVSDRDLNQGAIYPVFQELEKLAEANKAFAKDKKNTGILTVEVDKLHPFLILKQLMRSAQQADFITFKYMVSKLKS